MQISDLYTHVFQIIREALRHLLRQGSDESTLAFFRNAVYLSYQMVHLAFRLMELYYRVQTVSYTHLVQGNRTFLFRRTEDI